MKPMNHTSLLFGFLSIALLPVLPAGAQETETSTPAGSSRALSLEACLQQVVTQNFQIKASQARLEATRFREKAEWGIFEPDFVGSARIEENRRENTRQDFLSQASPLFDENNARYRAAVEGNLPTGGTIRLGGDTNRLENNLQTALNKEYVTFLGLTLRQPLLKDAGFETTMAQIRVAAEESEIVLNETRREMMSILSQAEIAYWELYRAEREYELRADSVRIAKEILQDNRDRVEAGKMSEIEVKKAVAELALRETQLEAAYQNRLDASARLNSFLGQESPTGAILEPEDSITVSPEAYSLEGSISQALENHPTLMVLRNTVEQEEIRKKYAKNQTLPDVSLNASYGMNGLDEEFSNSRAELFDNEFFSWFVGVEVQIPILNGVRERNEFQAAQIRMAGAEHRLRGAEVELSNLLRAMIQRVKSLKKQVADYREVVELQQDLLDAELTALELGRTDSRDVFEAEQQLTAAKLSALESLVNYQRRLIERELLEGVYLKKRDMDLI